METWNVVSVSLRSRIPDAYPLRAVQFPTVRLNENVSPGRMRRPVDVGTGEAEVDDPVLLQIDLVGAELVPQQRRMLADAHGKGHLALHDRSSST